MKILLRTLVVALVLRATIVLAQSGLLLLGVGGQAAAGGSPSFYLQEDGTSYYLQEDGSSKYKTESSS